MTAFAKRSFKHVVLVAVLTVMAAAGHASIATALTVSPTGSYTGSAGAERWGLPSNGQSITCRSARKTITFNAAGSGSIASGNAGFTDCSSAILGPVTITQTAAWTAQFVLVSGAVNLVITIPASGLRITGAGCSFAISGVITKQARVTGLPATISSLAIVSDTLRIDSNNSGLLCGFYPVGLAVDYSATLALSPSVTVSG